MNALTATWGAMPLPRKIALAGAVIATLALMIWIGRGAAQPPMALLYGGLDQRSAGQVVAALDQLGVASEVRGDQIYVAEGARDRVRMDLARQGLPQMGQSGYELLDQLSGFGTTSEMFQAAYWRAKEGELARTILSVPGVRAARVHIGANARRPFGRAVQKTTAAVTVRMSGGALTEKTAVSIRYLVALAVSNLEPDQVAVIDADNGVVLRPGQQNAAVAADAAGERRSAQLKGEIEQLLGVRFGPENVQVSVAVELNKKRETIAQTLVDPESGVPLSTETEEQTERSDGTDANVTVASDLPDGDAAAGGRRQSQRERIREVTSFKYSETRRNEVREAGGVKRIGVAVLVNHAAAQGPNGETSFAPRGPEELKAIEELVKSAMAFDAGRGDVVTVESMRFAELPELGSEVTTSTVERFVDNHLMTLIQLAVLALVALGLGLFVVRPILAAPPPPQELVLEPAVASGVPVPVATGETEADAAGDGAGTPAIEGGEAAAEQGALPSPTEQPLSLAAPDGGMPEPIESSLSERLRNAADDRSEETIQLLAKWLTVDAQTPEAR